MKKRKTQVMKKNSLENSMELIHMESQRVATVAFQGTGIHKNKKYDKKLRRKEGKKICKDEY